MIRIRFLSVALVLTLSLWIPPGDATTVESFRFEDLVYSAELIFEGRVIDVRTQEQDGLVYTYVLFSVVDLLKGDLSGELIELRFLGGRSGARTLIVSDVIIPVENERGIYFVESLTTKLLNPLLGWEQGHFVIRQDEFGQDSVAIKQQSLYRAIAFSKEKALQLKQLQSSPDIPPADSFKLTLSSLHNGLIGTALFKQEIFRLLETAQ